MMAGFGQFGPIEMGGMFTVMKVREGLAAGDYKDPGPYRNPQGTVAYEVQASAAGDAPRPSSGDAAVPGMKMPAQPGSAHDHH